MTCFVDTSALAKVYHREAGSEFMRSLYIGGDVIRISELTRVEFVSATRRKRQAGYIDLSFQRVCLRQFTQDLKSRYEVLRLTAGVIDEAARLLGPEGVSGPLRSLDAIQYATYKLLCPDDSIFVCSDHRLAAIARSDGRAALDPASP